MSLPNPPLQTGNTERDLDALYDYMWTVLEGFANAAGVAIDPSVGEGGDSSLTIVDTPDPITYTPSSGLSVDGMLFGQIEITFVKPDRTVDVIVFYREHSDDEDEDTSPFKQSYASMSPFRLINLKVGTHYHVKLAGQAANGSLGPESTLTLVEIPTEVITVGPPTSLQAVATYQSVVLTWVAPVGGRLLRYEVQRADDVNFTVNIVNWTVDATKFVDDVGVIGVIRYYRVRSVDTAGQASAYTASVSTTTLNVPDDSITYAKIQNVTESRLLLRGQGASAGDTQEGTVGTGLRLTGTTLTAEFVVVVPIGDPLGSQITTGDSKMYYAVGPELTGMILVYVGLSVSTVSSSGLPTYQLRRVRAGSGDVDMLSTKVAVDVSEIDSVTAATQPVIDPANDDVLTGDQIHFDKDVAGTGELGDQVRLRFALPLV